MYALSINELLSLRQASLDILAKKTYRNKSEILADIELEENILKNCPNLENYRIEHLHDELIQVEFYERINNLIKMGDTQRVCDRLDSAEVYYNKAFNQLQKEQ